MPCFLQLPNRRSRGVTSNFCTLGSRGDWAGSSSSDGKQQYYLPSKLKSGLVLPSPPLLTLLSRGVLKIPHPGHLLFPLKAAATHAHLPRSRLLGVHAEEKRDILQPYYSPPAISSPAKIMLCQTHLTPCICIPHAAPILKSHKLLPVET